MLKTKKLSFMLAIMFTCTILLTKGTMAADINPFTKMSTVKSVENKTSIKFNLSATNMSPAENAQMLQLLPLLSNLSLDLGTKSTTNTDNTKTDAYVNMTLNMMGTAYNMECWVTSDISKGKPNLTEIIKLPKNFPIPLSMDKDYIVIDTNTLSSGVDMPAINMADYTKETEKYVALLNSLINDINTNFKFTTDKGDITVPTPAGNVNAHAYQIKLNDADFKALIQYMMNNFSKNTELVNFIKDYMNKMNLPIGADFDKQLASATDELNKLFNEIKDLKIIGDKGIVLNYAVTTDGYIVSEDGTIDLVLDLGKIQAIADKLEGTSSSSSDKLTGIYNLGIDFKSVNFNINKDLKIDFPILTKANSIGIEELMGAQIVTSTDNKAQPVKDTKSPTTIVKKPVTTVNKPVTTVKKTVTTSTKKISTPAKKTTSVKKATTPAKKITTKKKATTKKK